jgi:processive 1,2-diacylglycerol beta-glucosyltransferase
MNPVRKVLILSASYGEGHQQAAKAIREALWKEDPAVEVRIVDYLQMVNPILDAFARYCYIQSVRFIPSFYGFLYERTNHIKSTSWIQNRLNQLGIQELEQYVKAFDPEIVISTFPIPAGVMSVLKERGIIDVPTATVITDHAVHSQWIHPCTDLYFVGSDDVKKQLLQRGIPDEKVYVTGIPIRNIFQKPVDCSELYPKYQLNPDLPIVLVMGGSYGVLKDIIKICEELFEYPKPIQVIVVCGRNSKLYEQILRKAQHATNPVRVFGFVQEVYELMAVSDFIVTKAGGLTISESLAMELPMLLYRPIPGQEEQNAKLLVRSGVAVLAHTRKQVFEHLHNLLRDDTQNPLRVMSQNAKRMKKPFSADCIAKEVLRNKSQIRTDRTVSISL